MQGFFIEEKGICFAGYHLIVDFWNAEKLDDVLFIKNALTTASIIGKGTILNTYFHEFSLNNGVSGVVTLAESHISVHTWPEYSFAAFDVFMCGRNALPHKVVESLKESFTPGRIELTELKRGGEK